MNYSPEFQPTIFIYVAAVRKSGIHVEKLQHDLHFIDWFSENYPTAFQQWQNELRKRELSVSDYIPLPVHPWQAKNVVPDLFKELMEMGELTLFENVSIQATPTLSFRTLASIENHDAAFIKLPVAVQATSTFRTLSSASTENAPKISRVLDAIFTKENNFDGRLNILREIFGLHLKNVSEVQAKHLTAIFRENPASQLLLNETVIVVAALFEKSPVSGSSLFVELMSSAGVSTLSEALVYFSQYVDLILGSYLKLYLMYGIALEGHQQNTLAVFQNGKIIRFIARDFDEVDIHDDTLRKQGYSLKLYPGSYNLWADKKHARNSLLHAVYQLHLGELVSLLAKHFKCEEHYFWHQIRLETNKVFFNLKDKMDYKIWQTEYHEILTADWPCKALLRMRLG